MSCALKQRLWLVNDRSIVKQIRRNSMVSNRKMLKLMDKILSNPSLFRVEHGNPPFLKSEVDFFRPVTIL